MKKKCFPLSIIVLLLFIHVLYSQKSYLRYKEERNVVKSKFGDELPVIESSKIAVVTALSTNNRDISNVFNLLFFTNFLKSFCKTASKYHAYTIYVGYDFDDPFLKNNDNVEKFEKKFRLNLRDDCFKFKISLKIKKFQYRGKPSWVQNDLMMDAYKDENEYFFKVHDDIILRTSRWTEIFISQLQSYNPKNLGVVGPYVEDKGINSNIILFEFVHKTHFQIFGLDYPKTFRGWFADDWISHVYQNDNSYTIKNVIVNHKYTDTRYDKVEKSANVLDHRLPFDKRKIQNFVKYSKHPLSILNTRKKIAIVFCNEEVSYSDYGINNLGTGFKLYLQDFEHLPNGLISNSNTSYIKTKNNKFTEQELIGDLMSQNSTNFDIIFIKSYPSRISEIDNEIINDMIYNDGVCQLYYGNNGNSNGDKIKILSLNLAKIFEKYPIFSKFYVKNRLKDKKLFIEILSSDCIVYTDGRRQDVPKNFKIIKQDPRNANLFHYEEVFVVESKNLLIPSLFLVCFVLTILFSVKKIVKI